jgi:hypothetical protein
MRPSDKSSTSSSSTTSSASKTRTVLPVHRYLVQRRAVKIREEKLIAQEPWTQVYVGSQNQFFDSVQPDQLFQYRAQV